MSDYRKDLVDILKAHGCQPVRNATRHYEMWQSPINGKRFPVKQNIKSRHTANAILKQAGLSKAF